MKVGSSMDRTIISPAQVFRPLYQDAYDALRDAIWQGRLAPGERIVEAELARQMAVSRQPIREAIRKLERDGLVEYKPRRGTVVVKLSTDGVRDAYYLRAHLEAYAAEFAARRATEQDFLALEEFVARMHKSAASDDLPGLIATDVEFHACVCQLSGSKRLYQIWESLNPHSWTLLTGLNLKGVDYSLFQIAERHRPLIDALRQRNPAVAADTFKRHIVELADHVLRRLEDHSVEDDNIADEPIKDRLRASRGMR